MVNDSMHVTDPKPRFQLQLGSDRWLDVTSVVLAFDGTAHMGLWPGTWETTIRVDARKCGRDLRIQPGNVIRMILADRDNVVSWDMPIQHVELVWQ